MLSNDGFCVVVRYLGGQSEISPLEQGNIDVAGVLNFGVRPLTPPVPNSPPIKVPPVVQAVPKNFGSKPEISRVGQTCCGAKDSAAASHQRGGYSAERPSANLCG